MTIFTGNPKSCLVTQKNTKDLRLRYFPVYVYIFFINLFTLLFNFVYIFYMHVLMEKKEEFMVTNVKYIKVISKILETKKKRRKQV